MAFFLYFVEFWLLYYSTAVLALQESTPFKDGNIAAHSFLDTRLICKCKGNFYNSVLIFRLENNIKFLLLLMVVLTIGLTTIFNSYIIPTKLTLRLLHGIKDNIQRIFINEKGNKERHIPKL
jgi:hypothetical protein